VIGATQALDNLQASKLIEDIYSRNFVQSSKLGKEVVEQSQDIVNDYIRSKNLLQNESAHFSKPKMGIKKKKGN
jgi:hypothetical protein